MAVVGSLALSWLLQEKEIEDALVTLTFRHDDKESLVHSDFRSSLSNLEALEQAINTDLAFAEFCSMFPFLSVRVDHAANLLHVEGVSSGGVPLADYWNQQAIDVAKLRALILQAPLLVSQPPLQSSLQPPPSNEAPQGNANAHGAATARYLRGATWTPSFRVTLPVFRARPVLECPEIVDLISGRSWRESSPVALSELAHLRVAHWDFEQQLRQGELVVHAEVAQEVLEIFRECFHKGVPFEKIRLVDRYFLPHERFLEGEALNRLEVEIDDRSMTDNNTSAFFARRKQPSGLWSNHSTGKAIDINPVQNPYVKKHLLSQEKDNNNNCSSYSAKPDTGVAYVTRTPHRKGQVEGTIVEAFEGKGWHWGGNWNDADLVKDYQHFAKDPRNSVIVSKK